MGCSRRGHALVGSELKTTPRTTPNPSTDLRVNPTTERGSSGGTTGARTSTTQRRQKADCIKLGRAHSLQGSSAAEDGQQKKPHPCTSDLDHPQEHPKFMRSIDRTRRPHNNSHKPHCLPLLPDKTLNTKDPNPIWVHVRYEATGRFGQVRVLGRSLQTQQPPSATPCLAQARFPIRNCPGRPRARAQLHAHGAAPCSDPLKSTWGVRGGVMRLWDQNLKPHPAPLQIRPRTYG